MNYKISEKEINNISDTLLNIPISAKHTINVINFLYSILTDSERQIPEEEVKKK